MGEDEQRCCDTALFFFGGGICAKPDDTHIQRKKKVKGEKISEFE